jgi:hypothetical protein
VKAGGASRRLGLPRSFEFREKIRITRILERGAELIQAVSLISGESGLVTEFSTVCSSGHPCCVRESPLIAQRGVLDRVERTTFIHAQTGCSSGHRHF